jgi:hypothetical protein
LCAEIRDRKEYRRVDCEEIRNYRLGTVQKLRLDTNEVFDVRPMNYDERQRVLPMLEQAAKDELDHAGKAIVDANKVGTIKVEAQETVEVVEAEPKRGRGRPKGSKNAPKQADAPKPAKGARKLRKGVKSTGEAMEQLS